MDVMESNGRGRHSRLVAIGLVGSGVIAGGTLATLGVASAAGTSSTTPSPSASGAPRFDRGAGPGPGFGMGRGMGRGIHGVETVQTGTSTFVTIDTQMGTVTGNDGTNLTVKSVDGFTATYSFDAKSVIDKSGAKATIADLKVGDKVRVEALAATSGNPVVRHVGDGRPAFGGHDGFGPGHGPDGGMPGMPPAPTAPGSAA